MNLDLINSDSYNAQTTPDNILEFSSKKYQNTE